MMYRSIWRYIAPLLRPGHGQNAKMIGTNLSKNTLMLHREIGSMATVGRICVPKTRHSRMFFTLYSKSHRIDSRKVMVPRAASTSSRSKHVYRCSECGETTLQWSGQCMSCKAWGTLEKEAIQVSSSSDAGGGGGGARAAARFAQSSKIGRGGQNDVAGESLEDDVGIMGSKRLRRGEETVENRRGSWIQEGEPPRKLSDVSRIQNNGQKAWRIRLPGPNGEELARVLGGGIVPGSLILVGGEPGVGKSTLLLQVADLVSKQSGGPEEVVLYVSGEESVEQIGSRAGRMGMEKNENVFIYSATRLDTVLDAVINLNPSAIIVDSIQTVYLDDLSSSAGSVVQVRECASALLQVAKRSRIPIFLVGHVTKTGDIAGPRVLEHIVDVVIYMEGGRQQSMRLVRCVKNRYGPTDEVGVFSMEDEGMIAVSNPSAFFLTSKDVASVCSAVTVILEGSRPLMMEVQALCSKLQSGSNAPPLRVPSGVRKERLWLILAVLSKHTRMKPFGVDVHVNVTGGLSVTEPSADLAIACAIASSYYERPMRRETAVLGEIGLGGELRPVTQLEKRILEAQKLGFERIIVPKSSDKLRTDKIKSINIVPAATVEEAFQHALGSRTESKSWQKKNEEENDDDDYI